MKKNRANELAFLLLFPGWLRNECDPWKLALLDSCCRHIFGYVRDHEFYSYVNYYADYEHDLSVDENDIIPEATLYERSFLCCRELDFSLSRIKELFGDMAVSPMEPEQLFCALYAGAILQ